MPSDFLTPFLELDEEFCKSFRSLETDDVPSCSLQQQRVLGFQRRHSLCPVTLPNSKFNSSSDAGEPSGWGLAGTTGSQWRRDVQLPRSSLSHIPYRMDRSVSMIEGGALASRDEALPSPMTLAPPPGFSFSDSNTSLSSGTPRTPVPPPHISTRYKTELCRTFEESGICKYGAKCQFAHGMDELRGLSRHPKYKTEPCRTFHTIGFCPYGARCHFIHNADEMLSQETHKPKPKPPMLRHSLSFAGFSNRMQTFQPVEEPSPLLFTRASSVSPPPSSTVSPELMSPLFPESGPLKIFPFTAMPDLTSDGADAALRFYALSEATKLQMFKLAQKLPEPTLHRCSSADSLSEEGYTSSCSLSSTSSDAESPSFEGRRLPIFSRMSIPGE